MARKERPHIKKLLRASGGISEIAEALNVSRQFVSLCVNRGWFPPPRAKQLEKLYGVPRRALMRPELVAALD